MFRKGFMYKVEERMKSEVTRKSLKKCIDCQSFIFLGWEYRCTHKGYTTIRTPNFRKECNDFVKAPKVWESCLECEYASGMEIEGLEGLMECRLFKGVSVFHPVKFASRCKARDNLPLLINVREPGNPWIV